MLKEKLLEDLKDAMKTKKMPFKWLEQQYYKLKKTRE